MKLKKQQFVEAQLGLVDAETEQPIEATFSDVVLTSSDETIFIIKDADGDGDPDLEGIGSGSAKLKVGAVATWFDKNGDKHVDGKEAEVDILVEFDTQNAKLVVSFTDPANIPADAGTNTATTAGDLNLRQQLQTGDQKQPAEDLTKQDVVTVENDSTDQQTENNAGPGPDQQQSQEEQQQ